MTKISLLPFLVACFLILSGTACSVKDSSKSKATSAQESPFLNAMRVVEEDGVKWYYDQQTTTMQNRNAFHFYLGQKGDNSPWIRFRHQYYGEIDLDLRHVEVRTNENSYMIYPDGEVSTNRRDGYSWNWFDKAADADLITMAMDVQTADNVLLRQTGKEVYFERALTPEERNGIRNVLGAYKALGGQWK